MPWYTFEKDKSYNVKDVVSACNQHIRSGAVKNKKEKWLRLKEISECGQDIIVYSPKDKSGWGKSPMNPHNWRTKDGQSIK